METFIISYSTHWCDITPPPSPEGELMETASIWGSESLAVSWFKNVAPPPSPEGELMETLSTFRSAS